MQHIASAPTSMLLSMAADVDKDGDLDVVALSFDDGYVCLCLNPLRQKGNLMRCTTVSLLIATMAIPLTLAWTDCNAWGDDGEGPAVSAANRRTAKLFSVSFGSRYTEDDFRRMAEKLDLLIIDPFSFREVPGVLRQTNPHMKVLGYCNTFDIEDLSRFADRDPTPGSKTAEMLEEWKRADAGDWFYLDPKGHRVNVYLNKVDNRYGLDLGKPGVRAFLAAKAKGIAAHGYDGALQLTLFDADNPGEGEIVINRKQTIPLPWGKGAAYNWRNFSFDPIPLDTAALVRGENRITVRRREGGVFKVTELTLHLTVPRE